MARTQAGVDNLVVLAELLQCAVVDVGGRMNFPTRHPLNQSSRASEAVAEAGQVRRFGQVGRHVPKRSEGKNP